ncbi:unnamed protein product [Allacma fusca]|uniref:Uncharacterized protein n=1 Tax=Allacma fusca TaxID=39272 RepID=A0A8J2K9Z2_9HEXA|nr:unnamed protein product [Allacma fusca]
MYRIAEHNNNCLPKVGEIFSKYSICESLRVALSLGLCQRSDSVLINGVEVDDCKKKMQEASVSSRLRRRLSSRHTTLELLHDVNVWIRVSRRVKKKTPLPCVYHSGDQRLKVNFSLGKKEGLPITLGFFYYHAAS